MTIRADHASIAMAFGRRQQPPGGKPARPPQPEPLRTVEAPPSQAPEPEAFNPNILPASKEFIAFLLARYDSGGGLVHAESIIGAAAALTGEFAQRTAGGPFGDGRPGYVFGDAINEVLIEGKAQGRVTVWDCIVHAARSTSLRESEVPDPIEVMTNVAAAASGPEFPPLTVPKKNYPHEYPPNACVRLRPHVLKIADRYDLTRRDLCIALGMATGGLIQITKDTLPPAIGVRLAAEIAFGVAKMMPLSEPIG
jgi:hypothetical protein